MNIFRYVNDLGAVTLSDYGIPILYKNDKLSDE